VVGVAKWGTRENRREGEKTKACEAQSKSGHQKQEWGKEEEGKRLVVEVCPAKTRYCAGGAKDDEEKKEIEGRGGRPRNHPKGNLRTTTLWRGPTFWGKEHSGGQEGQGTWGKSAREMVGGGGTHNNFENSL